MITSKIFPELTQEFVSLSNGEESKPLRVFVCQNRRLFPSLRFGSICGCKFISNPKFVSVKCPNGCGMRLDPVPVNPTCPDCRSTNVKWSDDSGVDESEMLHTLMTKGQSQIVNNGLEPDDIEMYPHLVESDKNIATIDPSHYGNGFEVNDRRKQDPEDAETISTNVNVRTFKYMHRKETPISMFQFNTAMKHFGFAPSPNLSYLNCEQIMKSLFYYRRLSQDPNCPNFIRDEAEESYSMWLGRLKTGNMNAGYVAPEKWTRDYKDPEHNIGFLENRIIPEKEMFSE